MSETLVITSQNVAAAVTHHLPGRSVVAVEDRGVWIRHNFRIRLDHDEIVYLKLDQDFPASEKEAYLCDLLCKHGLPVPQVLAVDASCILLPAPFVIQAHVGGEKLSDLLRRAEAADKVRIYQTLGRFYRRLHSIHYDHSGWIQGAGEVLPFSPCQHQYHEVIVNMGAEAVDRGVLAADVHARLTQWWLEHLAWLQQHTPSLVAGALPWVIYLEHDENWRVTKLMDLHDFLYWDPAWDLAGIKYPVFRSPLSSALWQAFLSEYGDLPSAKRLKLYRAMQHLDAAMGNYMEPASETNTRWKAEVWMYLEAFV